MAVGYRYIGCNAVFLCERSVECRSDNENQITVWRLHDHSPQLEHHGRLRELHAPTFWYQTLLVMLSPAFGMKHWYHAVTKSVCFSSLLYNNDGEDYADLLQPVQVLKNHPCRIHGSMILVQSRFAETLTLTQTLNPNPNPSPNFGESGFGESGRRHDFGPHTDSSFRGWGRLIREYIRYL